MVKPNRADLIAIALPGVPWLVSLVIEYVPRPVSSADWAAWVQGVGTIAAIFASYRFAAAQGEQARSTQRDQWLHDEARQRARVAASRFAGLSILRNGLHFAELAESTLSKADPSAISMTARMSSADFDGVVGQLLAFPVQDLGDHALVEILARSTSAATSARAFFQQLRERADAPAPPGFARRLPSTKEAAHEVEIFKTLVATYQERLALLGHIELG